MEKKLKRENTLLVLMLLFTLTLMSFMLVNFYDLSEKYEQLEEKYAELYQELSGESLSDLGYEE